MYQRWGRLGHRVKVWGRVGNKIYTLGASWSPGKLVNIGGGDLVNSGGDLVQVLGAIWKTLGAIWQWGDVSCSQIE